MPNDKLILLIHAKVLPEHRAELLQALRETLPLTRAEAGVELLFPTTQKDDPNTLDFLKSSRRKTRTISICSRNTQKNSSQRLRAGLRENPLSQICPNLASEPTRRGEQS